MCTSKLQQILLFLKRVLWRQRKPDRFLLISLLFFDLIMSGQDNYTGDLEDKIEIAIRTALTVAEDHLQNSGSSAFNEDLLFEISRSVIYHIGFEGEVADAYEELLMESIAPFSTHSIDQANLSLLTQVIQTVIEPVLLNRNDYYTHANDEEDDMEYIDQIGDHDDFPAGQNNETLMRARRKQLNITDSITTTSNNSEPQSEIEDDDQGVDEWMESVMQKSERKYLQEESEYGDVAPELSASEFHEQNPATEDDVLSSDPSSDADPDSVSLDRDASGVPLKACNHSSSSSDSEGTLHSESSLERRKQQRNEQPFQSPAPYQIRKSVHSYDPQAHALGASEPAESLPAWLMPKSPLDGYFRKGYGGLGHEELADVIEEVTSSQKKALRAGKIADDNELSSCSEDGVGGGEESDGEERSHTDVGELDQNQEPRPAWLMPKSPLDAHFRKGYGGLGHEDLDEAIEHITTTQKKARQQAASATIRRSQGNEDDDTNAIITLDDLPENFGLSTLVHTVPANTVGTPTNVRPARPLTASSSKTGSGGNGNNSRGIEYAKQQKLFQSPNPSSKIRVTVKNGHNHTIQTEESGAPQREKDQQQKVVEKEEEPLPAWLMPKSPLDAHFRKGYGGLGHEDLDEAIEHITSTQKKKKAARHALSLSQDSNGNSITKMLEHFYDSKPKPSSAAHGAAAIKMPFAKERKSLRRGKKATSKKSQGAAGLSSKAAANGASTRIGARKRKQKQRTSSADLWGEASENIMFDSDPISGIDPATADPATAGFRADGLVEEGEDHLLPSAHPSTSAPVDASGGVKLTNNPTLNAMMQDSFKAFVAQYTATNNKLNPKKSSARISTELSNGHSSRGGAEGKAQPSSASPKINPKRSSPHVPGSAKKRSATPQQAHKSSATTEEDQLAAYLASPQLQYSLHEIDDLIRANLSKLSKMQAKEQSLRNSFSSNLSLTDQENTPPRRKKSAAARPKLTKRASRYAAPTTAKPIAPESYKSVKAPVKPLAPKVSSTTLHTRSTGNLRASSVPTQVAAPRRSVTPPTTARSSSSHASRISKELLFGKPLVEALSSPPKPTSRSTTPLSRHSNGRQSQSAAVRTTASASRPLPPSSRLLAPTVATLIRSADITTNSSKAANIHNEWHLQLRVAENGEPDIELSGRKLSNKLLRRSIPSAADVDHIIGWHSPDKKSRSMDYLLNTSTHTSSSGAFSPPSSPLSSPHRRPSASTHYPQPLSKDSRLCAPTVATVMRSLDTAQHSPVIKRLHRELQEQTSRAYLFRGSKLVHNLNHLKEQKAARRKKKVKRKKSKPMKARSDSAEYQ